MRAVSCDTFVEKPSCDALAWFGLADDSTASGHAGYDRRTHGALQIEHRVVGSGFERTA